MTFIDLRVITINIKNYRDMERWQVREDAAKAFRNGDIILFQEIGEAEDLEDIHAVMPDHYATTDEIPKGAHHNKRGVTVAWNTALVEKLAEDTYEVSPWIERKGYFAPGPRFNKRVILRVKKGGFPNLAVHNLHFVNGAWTPGGDLNNEFRQSVWTNEHAVTTTRVQQDVAAGYLVLPGGDFNRRQGIKAFHPRQTWIVEGSNGIDHVGAILPKGMSVQVRAKIRLPLQSDHDLKGAMVRLMVLDRPAPKPPVIPTQPAPRPKPPQPRFPGSPVVHPWAPRSRRWKLKHPLLWRRILRWRRNHRWTRP